MRARVATLMILVLTAFGRVTQAGGPLVFARNGDTVKWAAGASTLTVTLDQGGLGTLTNAQADALVGNVLGVWGSVPECTADATAAPAELPEDVDDGNFLFYLETGIPLGYTPIIYDVDGAIIDSFLGAGQGNRVLGFASPIFQLDVRNPPFTLPADLPFLEGHVVLNGRFLDGVDTGASNPELTQTDFEGVIVHEFGHLLGLDHSQINVLDPTNDDQPTMFPLYLGGSSMRSLAPDDVGWISFLYPSAQFDASFGSIAGKILEFDGALFQDFQGINVIARQIGAGRVEASSCVSGCFYHQGDGPVDLEGRYLIPGVAPGTYTVEVEELLDLWTGGSSVGPRDPPVDFPGIAGPEFYDANESAWDDPAAQTPVSVVVGSGTANIDIVLNTMPQQAMDVGQWPLYR